MFVIVIMITIMIVIITAIIIAIQGRVRSCRAAGTRIFLPDIPGVGVIRTRYPVLPVHGEGSQVWKELEATKDVLLQSKTYG